MNKEKTYHIPKIKVLLQPREQEIEMTRPKSVMQLFNKLGIRRGTALVIRNGELLTPDREILPNDEIIVRIVTSSG